MPVRVHLSGAPWVLGCVQAISARGRRVAQASVAPSLPSCGPISVTVHPMDRAVSEVVRGLGLHSSSAVARGPWSVMLATLPRGSACLSPCPLLTRLPGGWSSRPGEPEARRPARCVAKGRAGLLVTGTFHSCSLGMDRDVVSFF